MQRMRNGPCLGRQHIQRPEKPCLEKKEGMMGEDKAEQVKRDFVGNEGILFGICGGCVFVCSATP